MPPERPIVTSALARSALTDTTKAIEEVVRLAAHVDVPVLITGPKADERVRCARLIHAAGPNRSGPFVAVSAAAILPAPVPSRPTGGNGHERAVAFRPLPRPYGGTLYIDDVADLNAFGQSQLFAFIGERARQAADGPENDRGIRIIAGASRHLDNERESGGFSESLFYQLNVIHLDLFTTSSQKGAGV